jgi:anthrone oxygenase-like protein
MLIAHLAFLLAAAFTGAAVYVAAVEQPARLALDDRAALTQWKPSYARGKVMQAALAALGGALALWAWWDGGGPLWLASGIVLLAPWPFTIVVILPTNHTLEAMSADQPNAETRALLIRWGHLHIVRAALGVVATLLMLLALSSSG